VIESSDSKPKTPIWHYVVIAGAVVVGVMMVAVLSQASWQLSAAKKAFHAYASALVAKNYSEAYQLTTQSFRATRDYNTFTETFQGLTTEMGDLKRVNVNRIDVNEYSDGWFGTADADLVFDHGDLHLSFTLKKENGAWKVYRYREQ